MGREAKASNSIPTPKSTPRITREVPVAPGPCQAGLGGRCIASPAFILRPAPDVLSSAPDTPRSWRVWRTLGTECPPNELRPHPRRAGCLLLQALSNSVTSATHNKLQFLLHEALGHSTKSRCSNSSRLLSLQGKHFPQKETSSSSLPPPPLAQAMGRRVLRRPECMLRAGIPQVEGEQEEQSS